MADYSTKWTDEELEKLEKRIAAIYEVAASDVEEKTFNYFKTFEKRFFKEMKAYKKGVYTDEQFLSWFRAQIGRGERWEHLRDDLAQRVEQAHKTAVELINDTTKDVFAQNYNYSAYTIERLGAKQKLPNGISIEGGFNLHDKHTVERLLKEDHELFPVAKNKPEFELAWNKKRINAALQQGILQGESISKIANRFQFGNKAGQIANTFMSVPYMSRAAAIRSARTAVTGAQSAGRQLSYEDAEAMGIEMEKEWISFIDNRTRDSHIRMDGVRVGVKEKFPNQLMYPADPSGTGAEVYNCRCGMIPVLKGFTDAQRTKNTKESYLQWLDEMKAEKARKKKEKR